MRSPACLRGRPELPRRRPCREQSWQRWDKLRLEYPEAHNTRAAWEPFLPSFEALARDLGVSESVKFRKLMSIVPPSLVRVLGEAQIQKYKVVVSCVTMRRAQRVPVSASQVPALVGEAERPERVELSEDGDWVVTWELQREYKKALGLHEKTGTLGEGIERYEYTNNSLGWKN